MKLYSIVSPSLDGVLSDDALYFEGIKKPSALYAVRDEVSDHDEIESMEILEKYFHDIYNLFLRKLSLFVSEEAPGAEESTKIQALLQEMIKVKNLITAASKNQEERESD